MVLHINSALLGGETAVIALSGVRPDRGHLWYRDAHHAGLGDLAKDFSRKAPQAGLLMGTGAALIPGGNDGLILFGLPAFSPHALPTWGAIVLGIALSIYVMRLTGMRVPKISCEGDVCRSTL